MENVSQLSNLTARLKRPPKLPSSHETRREWFPTRQNVPAPLIVLRLLGKLQKLSRLQAMHTKLQTAKLTVSHPHRMTHSSRTSTPPLDTVGVGWSTRKYCRQSSQATRRCRLPGWVLRRAAIAANMKGVSMPRSDNCSPTLFHRKKGKKLTQR